MLTQSNSFQSQFTTLYWMSASLTQMAQYDQAHDCLCKSLKGVLEWKFKPAIPDKLEGFAKLAVVQNQPDRAARFFGAAQKMRERMEIPIPPVERVDYEKHVTKTKRVLGKIEFSSAWKEGERMSVEKIIEQTINRPD